MEVFEMVERAGTRVGGMGEWVNGIHVPKVTINTSWLR